MSSAIPRVLLSQCSVLPGDVLWMVEPIVMSDRAVAGPKALWGEPLQLNGPVCPLPALPVKYSA